MHVDFNPFKEEGHMFEEVKVEKENRSRGKEKKDIIGKRARATRLYSGTHLVKYCSHLKFDENIILTP